MKINPEVKKNALWILLAIICGPIFLYQEYNKLFNDSKEHAEANTSLESIQTTRAAIQEIARYSEINSKKLMNISWTREESEVYGLLKSKYDPLATNVEGEFDCTIYSLPNTSAIANGNLECTADANFNTRLNISFSDKNKSFEYFESDSFKVIGKVTHIKIPSPEEIRVIELNSNLSLHNEFPTIVYINGDPILRKK